MVRISGYVITVYLMGFGIALGKVTEIIYKHYLQKRHISPNLPNACFALIMAIFMIFGTKISDYKTDSIWNIGRYAFQDSKSFLLVAEFHPPTYGALLNTQSKQITIEEFESKCEDYKSKNEAIFVVGHSQCLKGHLEADFFVEDDIYQVYRNHSVLLRNRLNDTQKLTPIIENNFNVYYYNQQLIFVKPNCNQDDQTNPFFLHLINQGWRQSNNYDFYFDAKGGLINNTCVAVVNIFNYRGKMQTGQYTESGRVWTAKAIIE